MKITSPISSGELVDKLSILQIKLQKITDAKKLKSVTEEHSLLKKLADKHLTGYTKYPERLNELFAVNNHLWEVEDQLRKKESLKQFDKKFTQLARLVYILNDARFEVKNKINSETNSTVLEQKSYTSY